MLELFQKFIDLGAIVVLPILIFIFGMALGTKPKKAFVSGIIVGVGFVPRAIPKIKIKIGRTTMAPKSINF